MQVLLHSPKLCCSANFFPEEVDWSGNNIFQYGVMNWEQPGPDCLWPNVAPNWQSCTDPLEKKKWGSLSFPLNGQVFPLWPKNPTHRPIWFANWDPYGEPERETMSGNGRGKLMTLSAPQMVTPAPLTPGNCLKLPESIRSKNLGNLCRSSKFDRSLPRDEV